MVAGFREAASAVAEGGRAAAVEAVAAVVQAPGAEAHEAAAGTKGLIRTRCFASAAGLVFNQQNSQSNDSGSRFRSDQCRPHSHPAR